MAQKSKVHGRILSDISPYRLFPPKNNSQPCLDEARKERIRKGLGINDDGESLRILKKIDDALQAYYYALKDSISLEQHNIYINHVNNVYNAAKILLEALSTEHGYSYSYFERLRYIYNNNMACEKTADEVKSDVFNTLRAIKCAADKVKSIGKEKNTQPGHLKLWLVGQLAPIWESATDTPLSRTTVYTNKGKGFRPTEFVKEVISVIDEIDESSADNLIRECESKIKHKQQEHIPRNLFYVMMRPPKNNARHLSHRLKIKNLSCRLLPKNVNDS